MRSFIFKLIVLLSVTAFSTYAQEATTKSVNTTVNPGIVKGILRDTAHNYVLRSATISVYKAADSALINYQISNNYGEFIFKNLPVDTKLRLDVSYVGYQSFRKIFTIPAGKNELDLKALIIVPRENMLEDVVISVPPISMNGDTLEFNAAAFKLDSNAVVEDLLRKIPNITLWGDGQITVNGREVKSVLVNGKPFFGGDIKTATQNISKNALQKVQVYSTALNKSNPLDSTLEMNLKLKKGKDIGYFGKIGGGYGTDGRYEADASFNIFSPKMNIAIVGATNNVNKMPDNVQQLVNNSTFKGMNTNVEYQPDFRESGLTTPKAAGATFSYNFVEKPTYENKKMIRADYFVTDKITDNISETQTITTISDSTGLRDQSSNNSRNSNTNQRFSSGFELVKSGHSLNIDQSMGMNQGDDVSNNFRTTQNQDNRLTSTNLSTSQSTFNNKSFNLNSNYNFNTRVWREKQFFKSFSASYALDVNDNESNRLTVTDFNSFTNPEDSRLFNRRYATQNNSVNQRFNFTSPDLMEKLAMKLYQSRFGLTLSNALAVRNSKDNNRVEDLDTLTNRYVGNAYLNNEVRVNVIDEAVTLDFRKSGYKGLANRYNKSWSINFSPKLKYLLQDNNSQKSFQDIRRNYVKVLPDASISYYNYQYGDYSRNYSLRFTNEIRIPDINQLAPLIDSSNVYYLRIGNAGLREIMDRKLSFNFGHYDQKTKNNLNYSINLSAGINENNIVDSLTIQQDGKQINYLVNADGNRYLDGNAQIRKSFKLKTSELQLSYYGNLNTSKNPGYYNGTFTFSSSLNTYSRVNINYSYKDKYALAISEILSTYTSKQEAFNRRNSNSNITSEFVTIYNVTKRFTLHSNLSYNIAKSSGGNDVNFTIWNASAVYRLLKGNNAEIKFSALDLLRQNTSIINSGSNNSSTIGTQNVLRQYFITTVSYFPRQFGKKTAKK